MPNQNDNNNILSLNLPERGFNFGHINIQGICGKDMTKFSELKTYAAISNAHFSRVCKRGKLSGSCLSTNNGFGSTQLSVILLSYRCSDIFLTK